MLNERKRLINKVKFQLPEINEFLNIIASIQVSYRGEKGTIKEHVESQVKEIIENKKLPKRKKSRKFLFNLLHVQVKDEVAEQAISALEQEYNHADINTIADIKSTDLEEILKKNHYRFPQRSKSLVEVASIIKNKFNGDLDEYLSYVENHYDDDPLLKVKGVSYKTRDWALSQFSSNYCLIDVHITNVLRNSGLLLYSYLYDIQLTTDRANEYQNMRLLLYKFVEQVQITPFELDQYLWFFGRFVCSKKKCSKCPVETCMLRNFK